MLALTVWEALWLATTACEDVVVGYPSVDRRGAERVAAAGVQRDRPPRAGSPLMVDAVEHLDLLGTLGPARGGGRVCLDADAGLWLLGGRVRVGPRRSPLHTPRRSRGFAREVDAPAGASLRGMMAYEGQIAGVGDRPAGRRCEGSRSARCSRPHGASCATAEPSWWRR